MSLNATRSFYPFVMSSALILAICGFASATAAPNVADTILQEQRQYQDYLLERQESENDILPGGIQEHNQSESEQISADIVFALS